MSKAKLCVPAIRFLRSCRIGWCFPSDTLPRFEIQGFLIRSVPAVGGIRVSMSYYNWFCSDYWVSGRTFCCKPEEGHCNRCWSCGSVVCSDVFLFCDLCRSIQPVDLSVDYFQIFGLEKGYYIKVDGLEGKYKDWQKKLHPDLVHSKSEKEQTYAAEQSARVIDAYHILSKPLLRALYLLQLEGIQVDEEKTVSDPELLTEIMEIREAVDEAESPEKLNQIKSQIQQKFKAWSNAFGDAINIRDFESAKTSIQRMTYYERATEEILKKL
ncbi:iron-sulfur cluster co-chaperone protein HscB homolog [Aristolochia californica]|uniref:iron-sulfur cluster co-chaperone protein HscB homolog n=1 Tax=Aristolochia californica TaxID=171875 RepID=UPI0035DBCABE